MSDSTQGASAADNTSAANAQIAYAYSTILGSFLLPASIYFACVTAYYALVEGYPNGLIIGAFTALNSVALFISYRSLRGGTDDINKIDGINVIAFSLAYIASLAHHILHFEPSKLVLFVLLTTITAACSIQFRVIVPAAIIGLVTPVWLAGQAGPEIQMQYAFISAAGMMTSVALVVLLRRAIIQQVLARMAADELTHDAERRARTNPISGLTNRWQFLRILAERLETARQEPFALFTLDINRFRSVNDIYGHIFGDQVLKELAQNLEMALDDLANPAHLASDEFAFVIEGDLSPRRLKRISDKLLALFSKPLIVDGIPVSISVAIGVALYPEAGSTAQKLFECAYYARARCGQNVASSVVFFSEAHKAELLRNGKLAHALANADFVEEFHLLYQPQVSLTTGEVIGVEALARWNSSLLGPVAPSDFIPAAERAGIMASLTPTLFEKALSDLSALPKDLKLSFNLSAHDLANPVTIQTLIRLMDEAGISAERLVFEVTETTALSDLAHTCAAAELLKSKGAHISLDDFGAGYSNFGQIDLLPIDGIKIDRSFVVGLARGEKAREAISLIVGFCRNLGLDCLIEGVEDEAELQSVIELGCAAVQGYYFSKPLPAGQLRTQIKKLELKLKPYRSVA